MQNIDYNVRLIDGDSEGFTAQQTEEMLCFLQNQVKQLINTQVCGAYLDMGNYKGSKALGLKDIKLPIERQFIGQQETWMCSYHKEHQWLFARIHVDPA